MTGRVVRSTTARLHEAKIVWPGAWGASARPTQASARMRRACASIRPHTALVTLNLKLTLTAAVSPITQIKLHD